MSVTLDVSQVEISPYLDSASLSSSNHSLTASLIVSLLNFILIFFNVFIYFILSFHPRIMFVNFKLEAQNLLNINKIRQPDYSGKYPQSKIVFSFFPISFNNKAMKSK
jgi:hypothetical protein